jgi:ribonuclease R
MDIDKNGTVLKSKLFEGLINSNKRMTYTEVTAILESGKKDKFFEDMKNLAEILRKKRERRGAIAFSSKESKIEVDKDLEVVAISPYKFGISNGIIEEFMLVANETVAEFMFKKGLPFVFRVHEKPSGEKLNTLNEFLAAMGFKDRFDVSSEPKKYAEVLARVKGEVCENLVSRVMLKSMQKARYVIENAGHFGLAAEFYCHFTSPIRRYPDLVIHRIIKLMLKNNEIYAKRLKNFAREAAVVSSEREKASENAERAVDDFYKACLMEKHIGEEFDGIISGVTGFGVFVELENSCEGLIRYERLPSDNYKFIEHTFTMKGTKRSFRLGDKVRIKVVAVSRETRRVDFEIVI